MGTSVWRSDYAWRSDSACTTSATPYKDNISNYESVVGEVLTFSNRVSPGRGMCYFKSADRSTLGMKVLHVPGLLCNLLSTRQLINGGRECITRQDHTFIRVPSRRASCHQEYL